MKIILDFDDTIFNTGCFINDFKAIFFRNGVSATVFKETYYSQKIKLENRIFKQYDLAIQLKKIKELGLETRKLEQELAVFLQGLGRYVFADFFEFSKQFNKNDLKLVSFGAGAFKDLKITESGVRKFFSEIKTGENKVQLINEIIKREKTDELWIIDDRIDQIEVIRKNFPKAKFFRIKRAAGRYNKEKTPKGIREIKSLSEI